MRPAEACKIIQQCLRHNTFIAKLHHADGAVTFRQSAAVGAKNHRQVRVHWRRRAECFHDVNLSRCVIEVIVTTNDMRDIHIEIVNHHRQVVGRRTVRSSNNQVIEFVVLDRDPAFHLVVNDNNAFGWRFETNNGSHAFGWRIGAMSTAAVVTWLQAGSSLLLAHHIQFFVRAIAGISLVFIQQLLDDIIVAIESIGLVKRAFVVFQPEPGHAFENGVDRLAG